jgi:hypothetical protein
VWGSDHRLLRTSCRARAQLTLGPARRRTAAIIRPRAASRRSVARRPPYCRPPGGERHRW